MANLLDIVLIVAFGGWAYRVAKRKGRDEVGWLLIAAAAFWVSGYAMEQVIFPSLAPKLGWPEGWAKPSGFIFGALVALAVDLYLTFLAPPLPPPRAGGGQPPEGGGGQPTPPKDEEKAPSAPSDAAAAREDFDLPPPPPEEADKVAPAAPDAPKGPEQQMSAAPPSRVRPLAPPALPSFTGSHPHPALSLEGTGVLQPPSLARRGVLEPPSLPGRG